MSDILAENVRMLKRLQDSKSTYNVYNWESDRKVSKYRIKQIARYEPSLLENNRRPKKHNRSVRQEPSPLANGPNKQLFDLYQQSVQMADDHQDSSSILPQIESKKMPMSGTNYNVLK